MKKLLLAIAFLTTSPLFAQQARDLFDAIQASRAHERDIIPALAQARETAGALRVLLRAEQKLVDSQLPAGSALDGAISMIDDYNHDLEMRKVFLPKDVRRIVDDARQLLDQSRLPMPADNALIRDQFHHLHVHRLSRRVLEDAAQTNNLLAAYIAIENQIRQLQTAELLTLANSETVPGLPAPAPGK
jgi:hypothetical protein